VLEFICNYLLPPCENDLALPICVQSCSEYLDKGICVEEMQNTFHLLTYNVFFNISIEVLLQDNCTLPLDIPTNDSHCNALTGKY